MKTTMRYSFSKYKLLTIGVVLVLAPIGATAFAEGDTCHVNSIRGVCLRYSRCKAKGELQYLQQAHHESLIIPWCNSNDEGTTSSLVCCRSKARAERLYEEGRQWNSLQVESIQRESNRNDDIENIFDLKKVLQDPKYDESGRKKHSIVQSDYNHVVNDRKQFTNNGQNMKTQEQSMKKNLYVPPLPSSNDYYLEIKPVQPYNENYPTTTQRASYSRRTTERYSHYQEDKRHPTYNSETEMKPQRPTSILDTHQATDNSNFNKYPTRKPTYFSEHQPTTSESDSQNPYRPMKPVQPNRRPSYNSEEQYRPVEPTKTQGYDGSQSQFSQPKYPSNSKPTGPSPAVEDENGYPIFTAPTHLRPTENKRKPKIRISQQKCKEYSEMVQETIAGLPLTTNPQPVEISIEKCNYNAQQLIVGGQNASLGEFPHMAAVGFRDPSRRTISWNCGGSLISENFVLTAAHCTTSSLGAPSIVRLGEHNLKKSNEGAHPVDYMVKEVIRHPEYKPPVRYHDIALLRLSRPVYFTPHIRPACLYQKQTFNTGKTVATGWGRIAYAEQQSDVLLKVVLSIIDNNKCNGLYRAESTTEVLSRGITSEQLCAGELTGGKDTCQGDSGGPIEVTSHSNQCVHHIIGVTSFGKKCGQPSAPGVYTRVSSYLSWIEKVVWENNS